MVENVCAHCGAEFQSKYPKVFCSLKCQRKGYYKNLRKPIMESTKKEHKKPSESIEQIQIKAREMGISYGKYVAMKEGGMLV